MIKKLKWKWALFGLLGATAAVATPIVLTSCSATTSTTNNDQLVVQTLNDRDIQPIVVNNDMFTKYRPIGTRTQNSSANIWNKQNQVFKYLLNNKNNAYLKMIQYYNTHPMNLDNLLNNKFGSQITSLQTLQNVLNYKSMFGTYLANPDTQTYNIATAFKFGSAYSLNNYSEYFSEDKFGLINSFISYFPSFQIDKHEGSVNMQNFHFFDNFTENADRTINFTVYGTTVIQISNQKLNSKLNIEKYKYNDGNFKGPQYDELFNLGHSELNQNVIILNWKTQYKNVTFDQTINVKPDNITKQNYYVQTVLYNNLNTYKMQEILQDPTSVTHFVKSGLLKSNTNTTLSTTYQSVYYKLQNSTQNNLQEFFSQLFDKSPEKNQPKIFNSTPIPLQLDLGKSEQLSKNVSDVMNVYGDINLPSDTLFNHLSDIINAINTHTLVTSDINVQKLTQEAQAKKITLSNSSTFDTGFNLISNQQDYVNSCMDCLGFLTHQ
ncbi:hypothetical protein [Ureaplasma ceti]|uniref:Lipoprotein n=1 Tax=Ureaplasma ceti TaxID=3119530 RepID=A0ABP9UD93_9BACT